MLWPNGLTVEPLMSTPESEADFGPRNIGKGFHDGVDYRNAFRLVRSIAAGRVVHVEKWDGRPWNSTRTQHGNRVHVDHGGGIVSTDSHLGRVDVVRNQLVAEGQSLGTMGATGYVTGVHLHFEVYVNGRLVDPRPFVRARIGGAPSSGGSTPFVPPVIETAKEEDMPTIISTADGQWLWDGPVLVPYTHPSEVQAALQAGFKVYETTREVQQRIAAAAAEIADEPRSFILVYGAADGTVYTFDGGKLEPVYDPTTLSLLSNMGGVDSVTWSAEEIRRRVQP